MPRFSLVIFDNDGVLVDSEGLANQALAEALTAAGVPHSAEECVARYLGGTLARVREIVAAKQSVVLPDSFEGDYYSRLFSAFRTGLRPVEGVVDVLDRLDDRGQSYCVASSGSRERVDLSLSITGLLERFSGRIFTAESVSRGKPAPDLFLHAAREMLVQPEKCVVVEDSLLGIQAANAAGMTSVAYTASNDDGTSRLATGGHITAMVDLLTVLI